MPWELFGNQDVKPSDYLGTSNERPLTIKTDNKERMEFGANGGVRINGGAALNLVAIGTDVPGIDYTNQQETVGIDSVSGDLRLQSPNNIFFHTGGADLTVVKPIERMTITKDGNVGIGTSDPRSRLDVVDRIRLRQGVSESAGLWLFQGTPARDRAFIGMADDSSVGLWGGTGASWGLLMDTSSGEVTIKGRLGIGTDPKNSLDVNGDIAISGKQALRANRSDQTWLGLNEGLGFTSGVWTPGLFAPDRLNVGGVDEWGDPGAGNVWIGGRLSLPKHGGGVAEFTTEGGWFQDTPAVSSDPAPGNLKLSFGYRPGSTAIPQYSFAIGHIEDYFVPWTPEVIPRGAFAGPLEVYRAPDMQGVTVRGKLEVFGHLNVSGAKSGYVVDHFINGEGDALEQGDVVVINSTDISHYSGADNNIPLPEVALTDKAYDYRACGIVAEVVTEGDLPFVEGQFRPSIEDIAYRANATEDAVRKALELGVNIFEVERVGHAGRISIGDVEAAKEKSTTEDDYSYADEIRRGGTPLQDQVGPIVHPLAQFAGEITPESDATRVEDQQLGRMVTMGAFAHCKVDADIAPVEAGDLLTTSPTKRYAQKVVEPETAVGAIVGKALASLREGKGKIPVMVILH